MSVRGDKGKELFESGYNCAQAVLMTFAGEAETDERTLEKISAGFGGGIGRMREVCGTVSGAVMALGLVCGDKVSKAELYSQIQEFAEKFKAANGSIICRELLGLNKGENDSPIPSPRTESYYKKRPCAELVKTAVELLEESLDGKEL